MQKGDKVYCIKTSYRDRCGYPLVIGDCYTIINIIPMVGDRCGVVVSNPHTGEKKQTKRGDVTTTTTFEDWLFYHNMPLEYEEFYDYFVDISHPIIRKMKLDKLNGN